MSAPGPGGTAGRVAVAGENVIDLVPADDPGTLRVLPGGSPANVAVALARLGDPVSLIARIGRDAFGARVRRRLEDDGVDGRHLVSAPEPSSLAVVSFDAERRPAYDFWFTGTADWAWREGELPAVLDPDVVALHTGSLALHLEPGAALLAALVRREHARGAVTVSLDPNIRPGVMGGAREVRERVEALLPHVHLVKASDEDLHGLYPGLTAEDAARRLLRAGPALVVVTGGDTGAFALTADGRVGVPAPAVTVADTVGAGDAFAAALLHALGVHGLLGGRLTHESPPAPAVLREVLEFAAAAAALACTRPGADAPTAAEVTAFTSRSGF